MSASQHSKEFLGNLDAAIGEQVWIMIDRGVLGTKTIEGTLVYFDAAGVVLWNADGQDAIEMRQIYDGGVVSTAES